MPTSPDTVVHRIGGSAIENLKLKTKEESLNPPGISVFLGGSWTMAVDPQQDLRLTDSLQRCFGSVSIRRIEGDRVFAHFAASSNFDVVAAMFREYEEAINDQLFHEVDRLSREIDALRLQLMSMDASGSLEIDDVQIMNGSDLSCRVPNLGLTQPTRAAAHVG